MAALQCFQPIEPDSKVNCANCERWDYSIFRCANEDEAIKGEVCVMSDKEKLTKLFDEFGIKYFTENHEKGTDIQLRAFVTRGYDLGLDFVPGKVGGYMGFETAFFFDQDGKFMRVDIYE